MNTPSDSAIAQAFREVMGADSPLSSTMRMDEAAQHVMKYARQLDAAKPAAACIWPDCGHDGNGVGQSCCRAIKQTDSVHSGGPCDEVPRTNPSEQHSAAAEFSYSDEDLLLVQIGSWTIADYLAVDDDEKLSLISRIAAVIRECAPPASAGELPEAVAWWNPSSEEVRKYTKDQVSANMDMLIKHGWQPLYTADQLRAAVAGKDARIERLAELRRQDGEYIKKMDGLLEEVGGVTVSCINPYEDHRRALLALKARAEKAEAAVAGEQQLAATYRRDAENSRAEAERLNSIINTPQADDFLRAVSTEAEHQRQRWGSGHDAGKEPSDWFWLIGYLAGKALHAHVSGNVDKAEHHIITTAAACANWHRAVFGKTDMRPGIDGDAALANCTEGASSSAAYMGSGDGKDMQS